MIAALLCLLAQGEPGVLLLRNRNVPEGAEVVAAWRSWHGFPDAPELVIDAPAEELIPRTVFEQAIESPLRAYLESEAGAQVLWIVPVYGVPLGVREQVGFDGSALTGTDRNEASVDSELALLRLERGDHSGWIVSPLFDRATPLAPEDRILGVVRLDGPSLAIAAALPAKAVLSELFGGAGTAFLDTRGLDDPEDGYGQRDIHMRGVRASWERMGVEVAADDLPAVSDLGGRTLLHYQGWYAGDPSAWRGAPRFRTGSIAVHLHSFAAHTLRDPAAYWVAPLLQWGATATWGTVFEPYTVGFPYEGVFWDRIADGWTFGEAAAAASQLLSWQAVFVGDPWWRPHPVNGAAECARRRAAFTAALRLWPADPSFTGSEARGWQHFDLALAAIQDSANQSREAIALQGLAELLMLCEGWEFDAAIAAALESSLGAMLGKTLKELERSLPRAPADSGLLQRFEDLAAGAAAFGLGERHQALRALLGEKQEEFVEQVLARKAPGAKSGRLLDYWQELRRAEACAYAARAAEAAPARLAFEADPERAEPLREEADKALAKHLREAEQLLRRERYAEAVARLTELDAAHPECASKLYLRTLLGQARKGAAGGGT